MGRGHGLHDCDRPIRNRGGNVPIVLESNQNHARAEDTEISPTLPASMGLGGGYVPMIVDVLPFDTTQITSDKNWSHPKYGDPCHPLANGQHPPHGRDKGDR